MAKVTISVDNGRDGFSTGDRFQREYDSRAEAEEAARTMLVEGLEHEAEDGHLRLFPASMIREVTVHPESA